jgi:hypothetical protein
MFNFLKWLFNPSWFTFSMGGGDGGGAPSAMTQTALSYAPEVQPLVNQVLAESAGLAQQQYQPYQYQRIAGFDPMQLQAQQATANLAVSPYVNPAAQMAGGAGQAGLAGIYNPSLLAGGSFTDPGMAQSYMSPYMQNVVDIGKREAQRQADIARTQRGFQASRAGAFGGSRQAISRWVTSRLEAVRQRTNRQHSSSSLSKHVVYRRHSLACSRRCRVRNS